MIGFIYIMNNPCIKGLLKIGFAKDVEKRRKTLSNSSVPEDYNILAKYKVNDMDKAEKMVFQILKEYRNKKEFFNCDFGIANQVCNIVSEEVNNFCPSNVLPDIDDIFELVLSFSE